MITIYINKETGPVNTGVIRFGTHDLFVSGKAVPLQTPEYVCRWDAARDILRETRPSCNRQTFNFLEICKSVSVNVLMAIKYCGLSNE